MPPSKSDKCMSNIYSFSFQHCLLEETAPTLNDGNMTAGAHVVVVFFVHSMQQTKKLIPLSNGY